MQKESINLTILSLFAALFISTGSTAQNVNDTIVILPAVEITDSLMHRMMPLSTVKMMDLQRVASADVGEVLRMEPNVSGIRKGGYAVDPVVRGFRYSQVNIYLDEGIHIEGGCPNRMDPVLSHIEPEDIQRIEIIRGPYMLRYGPSVAATIRVDTREPSPFSVQKTSVASFTGYDANRNGFRQNFSLSGTGKKIYYHISGGLKDFGNYTDGNGKEWESAYRKKNLSADVGYKLSSSEMLSLSWKGSYGRDILFPALPMDEIADNTNIFSALYHRQDPLNPDRQLSISGFHTRVYHEMDNRFRPQYSQVILPYTGLMQAVAKVNTSTTGVRASLSRKAGNIHVRAGLDSEIAMKDGTRQSRMIMEMDDQVFISEKNTNLWNDAFILNNGLYAGISSGTGRINYSATLRLDVNHSNSGDTLTIVKDNTTWFDAKPATRLLWSMATSAAWQIGRQMSLTLGLARGARSPDLQERYIKFLATGYDRYDYLGNPDLKPEVNYQADLMLQYNPDPVVFYINLFRSEVRNYITGTLVPPTVARPVSMGAPGVKQFSNIDRAVLCGFETGLSAVLAENLNVALSAGYTFAWFPEIEKIILENGQATGTVLLKNDPIAEIPALEAMIRTSYTFMKGNLQPAIEIRGVAAQKNISVASYEESTPGYMLTNFTIAYKLQKLATLTVGVNNIFDKAYYDHLNRRILGSTGKLYEPGRTFFVNLRIKI